MENRVLLEKPWGRFEQFILNEISTVKILSVKPNSKLSLQYHFQREEFWKVISGKGKVIIGEEMFTAKEDDEFYIKKKIKHRIVTDDTSIKILEISFGIFQEDDIVRIEDEYGRAKT
jgi:mannose-6-phosphate isomerase-like protein (cupin superfamily)